jgi:hypothetical protein
MSASVAQADGAGPMAHRAAKPHDSEVIGSLLRAKPLKLAMTEARTQDE